MSDSPPPPGADVPEIDTAAGPRRRRQRSVRALMERWQQRRFDWRQFLKTTGTSFVLHAAVILICSWIVVQSPQWDDVLSSIMRFDDGSDQGIEVIDDFPGGETQAEAPLGLPFPFPETMPVAALDSQLQAPTATPRDVESPLAIDVDISNAVAGRTAAARGALVSKYGGTAESEAAVAAGLQWLARHQFEDGGWRFDHAAHPECNGKCSQNGNMPECRTAATGLALLAFLGAGQTHRDGRYQQVVERGLAFLKSAGVSTSEGFDLRGKPADNHNHASFYAHAIAAIALCEAWAMTRDEELQSPAQRALDFIVAAQDPGGGGWRYSPRQAGDTSVVGWQIMALKSGENAGLKVPSDTYLLARKFLDKVQKAGGSRYVYISGSDRSPSASMTAVGLLCRMYLGWRPSHPNVKNGAQYLGTVRPSRNDMYYNYYATQVLHHYGGDEWTKWNEFLREHLIKTQRKEKDGHLAGSWDIADPHGGSGGRLYMTCLAVMTLEVYYRHLPLYQTGAFQ